MTADLEAFAIAESYLAQGDWEGAREAYREVLAAHPGSPKAGFGLGLALQGLGDHASAVDAFSRVIDVAPQVREGWYSRAVSHSALGQHESALEDCLHALSIDPDFDDAAYLCGSCLKSLDRRDEAIAILTQLLERAPHYHEARYCRATLSILKEDYRGAMEDLDLYLAQDAPTFAALQLRGLAADRAGMPNDALHFLDLAIQADPANASCHARRGKILEELGRSEEAAEAFSRVKELLGKSGEPGLPS
jgi:tetratricopeptide (TPR) repeat protein